ncbi:MAG: FMN-binding protein [Deltaproteobacteria bacterium RIFOXYD12_FULL_50_9]|nr:MAG: FMN-binding protein [Deltaproteobacteria bacterium RIFOXYD12_FULL_50_9]
MKDISTIILRLTIACLLAGIVMGGTFVLTNKAKKQNALHHEQKVMLSLLGYSAKNPAPSTLAMHEIYRYLITENSTQTMGYLLPVAGGGHGDFSFIRIDLDGKFLGRTPITIDPEKVSEEGDRTSTIQSTIGAGKALRYADQTIVVTNDKKRVAYLLPGKFPGFKTFISVILALDQEFTIRGLEIMEHEEDPGLGGEIVQDFFKNQFKGKPITTVKKLNVVKTPLPDEYLKALKAEKRGAISADEVAKIEAQYKDKDIYALTGATISSRSVTNGVKAIVQKFAYRLGILDRVLSEQQIAVPF